MKELDDEQREKLLEMLDTWEDAHRAIRVLKFIGRVAKWALGIGASAAFILTALHSGKTP